MLLAREQRRLAAILAADVVGFSRLMGRDESGTLARLKVHRSERLEPALARNGGRLVKLTGDGALAEFGSAVDALRAAIEFQQAVTEANQDHPEETRIVFRIGLHLGDLIVDGDDLYGDGVNVAARLEAEAPPGGIVISRTVHEAVVGKLRTTLHDLGELSLKNIERPVQAFRAEWISSDWPAHATVSSSPATVALKEDLPILPLPDKASIAVLPFQNMSGDPEQEYFADGMVEDIITALSRFKSLFVIARNSSFSYKGTSPDIRQVGRALGVRYVLEGSVRKAGNKVRITSQLIQAESGTHIWAERYDGDLTDIFDLQDKVTLAVVGAITTKLEHAEIERSRRKPTDNYDAYDFYLRALAIFYRGKRDDLNDARALCHQAIKLDSSFAVAHALAAGTYSRAKGFGLTPDESAVAETDRLARRAVELDRDDPIVLSFSSWTLAYVVNNLDLAAGLARRAITLNTNLATSWYVSGQINVWLGNPDLGIEHFERSMRLSPLDPQIGAIRAYSANAHFLAGHYVEALSLMRKVLEDWQSPIAYRFAAASAAMAGQQSEAKKFAELLLAADPSRRLSNMKGVLGPYRRPEDVGLIMEGLRLAGLPE